eukprot:839116-Ditylum_brightwellii.AAC.1
MNTLFDCEEIGEMDEYFRCKIEYNREERYMKLTQPVLLQSFIDEFELEDGGHIPMTLAEARSVLSKGEN